MLLFCAVLLFFIAWYGKRHDTREEYVSRNFFCVVDDKLTRVVGALEAIEGKLGEMSDLLRSTAGQKNIVDEGQRAKIIDEDQSA